MTIGPTLADGLAGNIEPGSVTIDLVENNPYLVIANESSSADLLVMGTHSKGRLASTFSIGALARHMLIEATGDVLTSPP